MAIANAVNGPESAPYLAKTGGTMSGAINMGSNLLNSVTNPVSAQDAATKNYVDTSVVSKSLVIGGNFDTNPWQRGTSFAAVTNGTYTADRYFWSLLGGGTGVVTISKVASAPTAAQAGIFSSNCINVAVTTADAAIAAGEQYSLTYRMEGYDWAQLAQRAITLSFWVNSSKTGIYCIALTNSGLDRSYVAEYTVLAANTWEFKTVTILASPSAGTWNYTTGVGISLNFTIAAGATFQTTANAWNVGNFVATANQVNGMDTIGNTFKFQLIKIDPGSVSLPFFTRNDGEELALCKRYFNKTFSTSTAPAAAVVPEGSAIYFCSVAGVSTNGAMFEFPVTMRASPTLTAFSPSIAGTTWYNITRALASGASAFLNTNERRACMSNLQVAGDVVGNTMALHVMASAEL
jgi:hypothetical protein